MAKCQFDNTDAIFGLDAGGTHNLPFVSVSDDFAIAKRHIGVWTKEISPELKVEVTSNAFDTVLQCVPVVVVIVETYQERVANVIQSPVCVEYKPVYVAGP